MLGFNAIKTEVLARLGNRTDLGARVERWINYAYFELIASPRFSFYELETSTAIVTVVGKNTYNLSADILNGEKIWVITSLYDESNRMLLKKSHMREMERKGSSYGYTSYGQNLIPGRPTHYARSDNVIALFPVPDAVYVIVLRYLQRPDDAVAGDDFIGLGTEWEELLVTLSVSKGFEAIGQVDRALELRQIIEHLISVREEAMKLDDANTEYGIEPSIDHP